MNQIEKPNSGASFWQQCKHSFGTEADRKNQKRFVLWMFLWAITLVAAAWLLKGEYLQAPFSWLIAGVPSVLGLIGLSAYLRFLREADELVQKIELEGLAIGFGVGVLFIIGYQLLELVGLPAIPARKIGAVMLFAWVFGQVIARSRYR